MKARKTFILITLLLAAIAGYAQTKEEVKEEIIRQGIPHPTIVLAQARLESGNFTSRLCKVNNNIFGIRHGKHYAKYNRWQDCVTDYKKRISSRYKGGDYYTFLINIRYAQSGPKYIVALKKIVRSEKTLIKKKSIERLNILNFTYNGKS